jgi:hypothetical protein
MNQCKGYRHPNQQLFKRCSSCKNQNDSGDLPPQLVKWVDRVCPEANEVEAE